MNKYLLLRDNKQSGPYTVPEIIEKGIKAYDLVWLDGKSVAWRYPSEIEELKAYAPAVEEQPFDRFYKRPEPVAKATQAAAAPADQSISQPSPYEPKITVESTVEELPPQKKVYVNFPVAPPPQKKIITEHTAPVTEKKVIHPEPTPEPVSFAEKTSYYQPAERIPSYNTKSSSNKNYIYYAAAACIVLVGFIVILFVNNSSQKERLNELNTIVKEIENKKANEAALATQIKNTIPEPAQPQTSETIINPELLSDNNYNQPAAGTKGSATATAEVAPTPKISEKPVEIAPGITYKERPVLRRSDKPQQDVVTAVDNEATETAPFSSENIYKLVSVKPNNYKTGVLGGISNLQFELTNNSKRELQKVAVEIRYLGPEKKVVNKQTVYFENVSPGEHSTIDVPKSKRGVTIDYTITDIKS